MKKILVSIFVVTFAIFGISFATPQPVNAASCADAADVSFFSFPTWYRGLHGTPNAQGGCDFGMQGQEIGPIVFTVALNIIDIALRVIAILAVGFVIYGGFRYLTSQGEPQATKNALDTILKAVIGLAIAMVSAIVVTFIVGRLNP
jgi:hypothetical protein